MLLEGKNVNLRLMERNDLPILHEWINNPEFMNKYEELKQESEAELEKTYDNLKDGQWFFVHKKDGTKIGYVAHYVADGKRELGYFILPEERQKGYANEAIQIIVDYLFLTKNIIRIQAQVDPENVASWKTLEKLGFQKEGMLRKAFYCRGKWKDDLIYSILREEWKEPKILTK